MRKLALVVRRDSSSPPHAPMASRLPAQHAAFVPQATRPLQLLRRHSRRQLTRRLHAPPPAPSLTLRHFAPKTKRIPHPPLSDLPPETPPAQNVAVVGGGLAGLAVAYHLLHSTRQQARARGQDPTALRVTLLDPAGPGAGGASAAAAGLLHGFTPRLKKKAWQPVRSLDAAARLLAAAQPHAPRELVKTPGLLRLALTEKLEEDFRIAANRYPSEVEFLEKDAVRDRFPHAPSDVCAAFIKKASVVDTPAYLRALWAACEASGRASWEHHAVEGLSELLADRSFDTVVMCAGAHIKGLSGMHNIPLTPCRGQNLRLETSDPDRVLAAPFISGKYVIPDYFPGPLEDTEAGPDTPPVHRMIAGATFEYREETETEAAYLQRGSRASNSRAMAQLRNPVHKLVPGIFQGWKVRGAFVGLRALPPRSNVGSIPIACRVRGTGDEVGCWIFSGLGSRGLLHHAYVGRVLAKAIVAGHEKLIHGDARRLKISMESSES